MNLTRFSCGCIGQKLKDDRTVNGTHWIKAQVIRSCTSELGFHENSVIETSISTRDGVVLQDSRPCTEEETKELLQELNTLLAAGERFQQLKALLEIK